MRSRKTAKNFDLFTLALLLCLFFGTLLANRPLGVPDEGRYSEIPREMLVSKDFVTPHLNHVKYLEKPPLYYWLVAGSMKVFGTTLFASRVVTALMALFGCLITYLTAFHCYDRRTARIASVILSTSFLYYGMSQLNTIDMTLSTFLSLSLMCFVVGINCPEKKRSYFYLGIYVFSGLAVLTKGLVGILFPVAIIGSWIILLQEWQLWRKLYLVPGLLIFLAITLPWHLMVQQVNPEFFRYAILDQQFARFLTNSAHRSQPIWWYIPMLLLAFFPWSAFLFQGLAFNLKGLWQKRFAEKETCFLLLWASIIFSFFSLSHSKLLPYILPVFPPLAILIARYFADFFQHQQHRKGLLIGFFSATIVAGCLAISLLVLPHFYLVAQPASAQIWLYTIALTTLLFCVAAWWGWHHKIAYAISTLAISAGIVWMMVNLSSIYIYHDSIQPLAHALQKITTSQDEIMTFSKYYQDLPFYLQRRISIVESVPDFGGTSWRDELGFGMQHQNTSAWILNTHSFSSRWSSTSRKFLLTPKIALEDLYQAFPALSFVVVGESSNDILLTNHPFEK